MNKLVSTLREALNTSSERRKPAQYRSWAVKMGRVVSEKLLPLFCSLKDTIDDHTRRALMKQVCEILTELEPSLQAPAPPPSASAADGSGGDQTAVSAKQSLLELWHHLLDVVERIPASEVAPIVLAVVVGVLRRPEFDVSHLHIDVHHHATCPAHDIMFAFRYRQLLFATLAYVTRVLGAAAEDPGPLPVKPKRRRPRNIVPGSDGVSPLAVIQAIAERYDGEDGEGDYAEDPTQQLDVLDMPSATTTTTTTETATTTTTTADTQSTPPSASSAKQEHGGDQKASDGAATSAGGDGEVEKPPLEVAEKHVVVVDEVSAMPSSGSASEHPLALAPSSATTTATDQEPPQAKPPKASPVQALVAEEGGGAGRFMSPPPLPRASSRSPGRPSPPPHVSSLSVPFVTFAAKVLAVVYWRLPFVQADVKKAVMEGVPIDARLRLAKPAEMLSPDIYPSLLCWGIYHDTMRSWNKDDEEEKLARAPKAWLAHLSRHGDVFLEFFCEWLTHVCSVIHNREAGWVGLPGYVEFTRAYFHTISTTPLEQLSQRTVSTCETLLLETEHPAIINALIRFGYARTPAREINSVIAMLLAIEAWMFELMKKKRVLGDGFDVAHFCEGFDLILQTDHHLIVAKELAIIYSVAEMFQGEARVHIFGDLLLRKHFFHLFLHWDENVRNIYCQVLAFKMLQTKRKMLSLASDKKNRRTKSTQNLAKKTPDSDKSAPPNIDMLLMVKIEAYVRIVTDYLDKKAISQASSSISAMSLTPTPQAPKAKAKKQYIVQNAPEPPSFSVSPELPEAASAAPQTRGITVAWAEQSAAPSSAAAVPQRASSPVQAGKKSTSFEETEPSADQFPTHLGVYAQRAMEDYRRHMTRYNEWQSRSTNEAPKLLTLQ